MSILRRIAEVASRFDWLSIEVDETTDEDRSCTGKVRYGHRETAERAVLDMEGKGGKPLESYPCRYCGGWHIGGRTW